jgi:hypothetical protein
MAYEKLNLITGDLLDQDVFEHLEEGIEQGCKCFEDLYDTKNDVIYTSLYKSITSNAGSDYAHSTFTGWCACVGNPEYFDSIKFYVKARSGYPITTLTVEICELPDENEVTFNASSITPGPNNWVVLGSKTINLEEPITDTSSPTLVSMDFDQRVINGNSRYLMAKIYSTVQCTLRLGENTFNNIPYNPWFYWTTTGSSFSASTGSYSPTSKTVRVLYMEFFDKLVLEDYKTIGTDPKDKFHKLFAECLEKSESLGSIFETKIKSKYLIGSQNTTVNSKYSIPDSNRSFTGVLFPIGIIPSEIVSHGCTIPITARSYNGSTTSITKATAYLYSVEEVPEKSFIGSSGVNLLEPTLLRTIETSTLINNGETVTVNFIWDKPFQNTDNKFLMLGYACNSYISRTKVSGGLTHAKFCKTIDGNSYTNLVSFYNAQTNKVAWGNGFYEDTVNSFALTEFSNYYDFGEQFYNILDEKIQEVFGSTTFKPTPTSEVRLAKQYDVVVGDTFQLFYEGVIKSFNPLDQGIRVICSVGKQLQRYFEFTPTDANANKTYDLTISTRQLDGSIISTGKTKIVVHPKLTNQTTPSNVNMLFFGDSLTGAGMWCSEGVRRIYGAVDADAVGPVSDGVTNTVTSYGSKKNTNNTFTIRHEGYSGWMWSSFISTSSASSTTSQLITVLNSNHNYDLDDVRKSSWVDNNGLLWELEELPSENSIKFNRGEGNNGAQNSIIIPTTLTCEVLSLTLTNFADVNFSSNNPFYNELTGELDFINHAQRNSNEGADIVSCLLTWNGASPTADFDNSSRIQNHMNDAATLLRKIHTDLPNAKVICLGIQISDLNGGCGSAYGATGGYSDTWATAFYAFDYNKALEDLCTNDEFKSYVYYVDVKGQFDSRYNMPANYKQVNTRNPNLKELVGANGVHAYNGYGTGGYGYYQIGDALYRALTKVIPIVKQIKETK